MTQTLGPQGPGGSLTVTENNELSFPVLTDTGGAVRFLDVRPDYTQRTKPSAVLDAVRALSSS